MSIPDDLLDAARIAGAGEYGIFFRIVFPLAKPAMATIGITSFFGIWDALLWPLIVLNTEAKYTLPIGLAFFHRQYYVLWGPVMGGALIMIVPSVIVFIILQRHLIENIALSGIKG